MQIESFQHIVFFDGVCSLCNNGVDFLLKIDKREKLMFSPLQGEEACKCLTEKQRIDLDSFVFYSKGRVFVKSKAIIEVFRVIGGIWSIFIFFKVMPVFFSDYVYTAVAKSRYGMFGKRDVCRMPSEKERYRFLE